MAEEPYENGTPRKSRVASLLHEYTPRTASDDTSAISVRGHNLPGLLPQSYSTSNLAALRARANRARRNGSIGGLTGEDVAAAPNGRRGSEESDASRETPLLMRRKSAFPWTGANGGGSGSGGGGEPDYEDLRRMSIPASMIAPHMRSERLIGNSNPRYQWEQYWKSDQQLSEMKKPLRKYYERTNYLIQNYLYIDRLLDSSLPHVLLMEYEQSNGISTIAEESSPENGSSDGGLQNADSTGPKSKLKRTPRDLYRIKENAVENAETEPLLKRTNTRGDIEQLLPPDFDNDEDSSSQSRVVQIAIYMNLIANTVLLILKIIVVALSSSVSVLASLVDAALDFLSTAIVWTTTYIIAQQDQYAYPIGRRRLEPVGVLVFSVIMITSFVQVGLEGINKLSGTDHEIVELGIPAIAIMLATVVIKFLCWLWCRMIRNSSVQALAQDAMTDVVFNIFSIIFPLVGFYARVWWLDPLGGILLSLWVILNWAQTSSTHIRNLTGAAASADERNILLYLTMRFAKSIRKIQGIQAYHSGDKLNVEVDVVLDEYTSLRDSHDLGESLQYVLESVPTVDRAFVHMDYLDYNLPSHMQQDS